jgi:hypothetical protein
LGRLIAASYLDVVGLAWNHRIPPTDRANRDPLCIIVTCQTPQLSPNLEKLQVWCPEVDPVFLDTGLGDNT